MLTTQTTNAKVGTITAYKIGWRNSIEKNLFKTFALKSSYPAGDINLDGVVNATDKTLLSKYFKGTAKLSYMQLVMAGYSFGSDVSMSRWFDKSIVSNTSTSITIGNSSSSFTVKKGDVNFDGVCDSADTALITKINNGTANNGVPFYLQSLVAAQ